MPQVVGKVKLRKNLTTRFAASMPYPWVTPQSVIGKSSIGLNMARFRSLATGDGTDGYVSIRNSMEARMGSVTRAIAASRSQVTVGSWLAIRIFGLRSSQLHTGLRRLARMWDAAAPVQTRDGSSRQFTSRTPCTLFSIVQCKRTAFRSASGDRLPGPRLHSPTTFLAGFRPFSG